MPHQARGSLHIKCVQYCIIKQYNMLALYHQARGSLHIKHIYYCIIKHMQYNGKVFFISIEYFGVWQCLSSIIREEGVLGLFKGLRLRRIIRQ